MFVVDTRASDNAANICGYKFIMIVLDSPYLTFTYLRNGKSRITIIFFLSYFELGRLEQVRVVFYFGGPGFLEQTDQVI